MENWRKERVEEIILSAKNLIESKERHEHSTAFAFGVMITCVKQIAGALDIEAIDDIKLK